MSNRRSPPPPPPPPTPPASNDEDHGLAALLEMFEEREPQELLSALRQTDGDVQAAALCVLSQHHNKRRKTPLAALAISTTDHLERTRHIASKNPVAASRWPAVIGSTTPPPRSATWPPKPPLKGQQRSIQSFFAATHDPSTSVPLAEGSPDAADHLKESAALSAVANANTHRSASAPDRDDLRPSQDLPNLHEVLKWRPSDNPGTSLKSRHIPEKALDLFRPEDVSRHTPCELFFDVLPADLAKTLLLQLMDDAKGFRRRQWYLFENFVTSPHTTKFYATRAAPNPAVNEMFDGTDGPAAFPPPMEQAREIIENIVNGRLASRERHPFETQGRWTANVAAVNCYKDSKETVGWHSDRLTNIGPMPTIASLTLGVTRKFRLRKVDPNGLGRVFSIELPHNSLLIMNPPCQGCRKLSFQEYRHDVPPVLSLTPHAIGGTTRINLTFRMFRAEYGDSHTPTCRCGDKCILRVVQKKEKTTGKYFYACYAHARKPGGKGCEFFEWMEPVTMATATTSRSAVT